MRKVKWKIWIVAFIVGTGILSGSSSLAVHAAEKGSVSMYYHGKTKDNCDTELADASFVLYKAAVYQRDIWVPAEGFSRSGITIDTESASGQKKSAEKLYQYAVRKKLNGTILHTDSTGRLRYNELDKGMYLIAQKAPVKGGKQFFLAPPFLISIPMTEDQTLQYDLVIEPKSEWQEETESADLVKTGDTGKTGMYLLLLGLSTLAFAASWNSLFSCRTIMEICVKCRKN